MEEKLLTRIYSRLIKFRDAIVASDAIVPLWVNDSIDEIEASQKELQGEFPATGDLQDILGDCPAGTNWASRPEYQSREA